MSHLVGVAGFLPLSTSGSLSADVFMMLVGAGFDSAVHGQVDRMP